MLQLRDLTVGDVSGMIAAGIFVGTLLLHGPSYQPGQITIAYYNQFRYLSLQPCRLFFSDF
jgi:hypothetical protein